MRVLMVLEVSGKQAFIFRSNLLSENALNSALIERVTTCEFLKKSGGKEVPFKEERNLVYRGGGHCVLEFSTVEQARRFGNLYSSKILREYEGMEVFIKVEEYEESQAQGDCLDDLLEKLEQKKSFHRQAFHQGSFGIEEIDVNTKLPVLKNTVRQKMTEDEMNLLVLDEYGESKELDYIGISRDKSSYIAVVHIDGNAMGKRVKEFKESIRNRKWEGYKAELKKFSDKIDEQYKEAFRNMTKKVKENLEAGKLCDLTLGEKILPLRRIITAGDDICFVSEGRIGLECARIFLEELQHTPGYDKKKNYACAGVAIVHYKYPFYRAYELAESLCSNAKQYAKTLGEASAIDWHIEQGEVFSDIKTVREEYLTRDGKRMELRPYWIGKDRQDAEKIRNYKNFRELASALAANKSYAGGKLKGLRSVIKDGEEATAYYMKSNLMDEWGITDSKNTFQETSDGVKHAVCFDAIEIMDTFIALESRRKKK